MSEARSASDIGTDDAANRQKPGGLADSSVSGTVVKACCVCGISLAGRTRFKDSQGHYWCPACNDKDQSMKESAACPDCTQQFVRGELIEFKGTPVCKECWEKRRQAAKREEARLRRLEEEIREEKENRRRWIIRGIVAAIVLAVWAILMFGFWILYHMHDSNIHPQ